MKQLKTVPILERTCFSCRFEQRTYDAVQDLSRKEDKSMQVVVDEAVMAYVDFKKSGKTDSYLELGKLIKEERTLLKTALHMYRNAKASDREILIAILNWWRRKWQ